MMSAKPDGGAAFPSPGVVLSDGTQQGAYEGMTLRDYFASKALECMLNSSRFDSLSKAADRAAIADQLDTAVAAACYRYADAMLAERVK